MTALIKRHFIDNLTLLIIIYERLDILFDCLRQIFFQKSFQKKPILFMQYRLLQYKNKTNNTLLIGKLIIGTF